MFTDFDQDEPAKEWVAESPAASRAADTTRATSPPVEAPTAPSAGMNPSGVPLYAVSEKHTRLATEMRRITLCWHNMLTFYQTIFTLDIPADERRDNKEEFYQRADVVSSAQMEFAEDFSLRGLVAEEADLFELVKTFYAFVVENLAEMVASLARFIPTAPKVEVKSIPTMSLELALGIIDGMNPLYRLINNGLIGAVMGTNNEASLLYLLNYEDNINFYSAQYESPLPVNSAADLNGRAHIKQWVESHAERIFEVTVLSKSFVTGDKF